MSENLDSLNQKWAEENNDLKALGIGKKIIREERNERWEDKWLPRFRQLFDDRIWYEEKMSCWRIHVSAEEMYDYYPKANKVFAYPSKKWIEKGLKFLIKNFIK